MRARDGGGADEQAAEALGVDCESCHPGAAPHADARSHGGARRAGTAPCATCHEFASPGATTLLQSTETEHAASAHRDTPCVSCHMKRLGSQGRDHRFAVSRAPDFLRGALSLGGAEVGADEVSFTLRARDVGHAFPTGDIFRQLLVEATLEADDGRILAVVERSLRRDWDAHRRAYRSTQASEEADTRLFDAPRRLSVPLVAGATRLVVRVRYQRGFEARGNALALFSSTPLAEASFPLSAARR